MSSYGALHELGERGRAVERARGPEPYPRASGPAPSLAELRRRRDQILDVAAAHGAGSVRVFGSVARGQQQPGSDVDVLVDLSGRGLLEQAALARELEQLLGCPVQVVTVSALQAAEQQTRARIEAEALVL